METPQQRPAIVFAPLLAFVFFAISARAQWLNYFGHLDVFSDENEKNRAQIEQK